MADIKSQKKRIRTNEAARMRLDMAAAKHVIHKNQASNRKSGLAKLVNSINA